MDFAVGMTLLTVVGIYWLVKIVLFISEASTRPRKLVRVDGRYSWEPVKRKKRSAEERLKPLFFAGIGVFAVVVILISAPH